MSKFNIDTAKADSKEDIPKEQPKVKSKPKTKAKKQAKLSEERKMTIAKCVKCNGNPPEEKFELSDMEGLRCGICWEVISWNKK